MVKTPTYEVFAMYQGHQGATLVDSVIDQQWDGAGGVEVPVLSESVSVTEGEGGKNAVITLSNASLGETYQVAVNLPVNQRFAGKAKISLLTEDAHACNTFENPERVEASVRKEEWSGNRAMVTLPPCSVVSIECGVACDEA